MENENGKATSINGQWKRGNFHGHGTYTRSDGHKFVGEWKNNVLNDFTEYDKYGNLVRHILIIFSILLLYSPLFGQVDCGFIERIRSHTPFKHIHFTYFGVSKRSGTSSTCRNFYGYLYISY